MTELKIAVNEGCDCSDCLYHEARCLRLNACVRWFEEQCEGCSLEESAAKDREFDERVALRGI